MLPLLPMLPPGFNRSCFVGGSLPFQLSDSDAAQAPARGLAESSELQRNPATDDVDQGPEKLDAEEPSGEQEADVSTEHPPSNEPPDGEFSSSSQPPEANEPKAAPANAAAAANAASGL